jgi:hypothetical protein
MQRRLAGPLVVLVAAACGGQAFTSVANEGSPDAGSIDTGIADSAADGTSGDAARPPDGAEPDAVAGEAGMSEAGIPPVDGGPSDAATCVRTCPYGFDCIAGKCEDHVALHFAPANNPSLQNWRYGYNTSFGGTFVIYPSSWKVGTMGTTTIDVWSIATNNIEPSAFHNHTIGTVLADGMSVPPLAFGLYPGPLGEVSTARWIAPAAGFYSITVTFTGISTPSTVASVGVSVNNLVGLPGTDGSLNRFLGDTNMFAYSGASQKLNASDTVDFYAYSSVTSDDPAGGVEVDATISAQ